MKTATSPTELLIPLDAKTGTPLRTQVERGLRQAIRAGRLAAGAPLPSTRVLAVDLGVSRGVVLGAYEQLLAEGYLTARQGSATRVAARCEEVAAGRSAIPARTVPYSFDFRPGVPDLSLFPRRSWLRSVRQVIDLSPTGDFDYPDPRGSEAARTELAAYLNRARATVTAGDRIVLCNGFAQGAWLVGQALRASGVHRIGVEDPGHADQCADLAGAGLELVRIPVDDDGIRADLLEGADVGAVLVTPAHQYPTGAVLSSDRRAALLGWATRRGAVILEDDYDAEYRYDREPIGSLQGLAPDRVVYLGTASKMLAPGLRLGWLALPAHLVGGVGQAKLDADRGSPSLDQLALADFLHRGELDRHLRRTRRIYRRRRDALVSALTRYLPQLRIRGVAAGLHLMVELGPNAREQEIVATAEKRSMRVVGASVYRSNPAHGTPALLLGYGGLDENIIDLAVKRLETLLREHDVQPERV